MDCPMILGHTDRTGRRDGANLHIGRSLVRAFSNPGAVMLCSGPTAYLTPD